jgi:hypothetical protein
MSRISNVLKGIHQEAEDAGGVRKYKGNRNLRLARENFRNLKAVSGVLSLPRPYLSAATDIRRYGTAIGRP